MGAFLALPITASLQAIFRVYTKRYDLIDSPLMNDPEPKKKSKMVEAADAINEHVIKLVSDHMPRQAKGTSAHVTFDLPYVLLSVTPRFKALDKSMSEAAQDLGCTPARAFFMVDLPEILPGIVSALMMSFTLSLDDFVISHFVSSPNFQTLPLYVYNQTAHNVKFSMYALCALIVFIILAILLVVNFAGSFRSVRHRKGGA